MEVAAFEQELAQADGGVIGIGEKGVFDDDARPATGLENFDEVLQKEKGGLSGLDGEVLLHLGPLFAAEGGIGNNDVVPVALLYVRKVFGKSVGMHNIGGFFFCTT